MPLFMQGRVLLSLSQNVIHLSPVVPFPAASQLADDPTVRAVFRNEAGSVVLGGGNVLKAGYFVKKRLPSGLIS